MYPTCVLEYLSVFLVNVFDDEALNNGIHDKRHKIPVVREVIRVHYDVFDKEIQLLL